MVTDATILSRGATLPCNAVADIVVPNVRTENKYDKIRVFSSKKKCVSYVRKNYGR